MALSDTACRAAKPRERDWKLADEKGLFLLVRASGAKLWRLRYRFDGKEKLLSLGPYPETSLKQARAARDEARTLLHRGIDPSAERRDRKAKARAEALNSFERAARAWHAARSMTLTPRYAGQIMDRLEADVFPKIGRRPIAEIEPAEVLALLRAIEKRGAREMAHRVRMHLSDVFVWAIAEGLARDDPASTIRKALLPADGRLRPARRKLDQAREVLAKTEELADAWWATRLASRLLALTAARPGVVRLAERSEFEGLDGPEPLWRIPAEKMKLTRERRRDASFEFAVPLSRQAVEVVEAAMRASASPDWLFPGIAGWRRPISDSTLSKHYRLAGFRGQHVPHGWRSSFSTIMNERAAIEGREGDRAVIELMLAHLPDGVEASYNRAAYMPRRRAIAQAWADMLLEGMRPVAELLPEALRR